MSVGVSLGGLLFKRLPGVTLVSTIALSSLVLIFWGASVISQDLDQTIHGTELEKIVTLTVSDAANADAVAEKLKGHPGKVTIVPKAEVKEMLGEMDPQLRSLLLGVGSEAENLVPTMVSYRGAIETEFIESIRKVQGVLKLHERTAFEGPYRDSLSRLLFQVDLIRYLLWVASLAIALLFTRIVAREFHPIAKNLEHWGVPLLRIRLPLTLVVSFVILMAHAIAFLVWKSMLPRGTLGLSLLSGGGVGVPEVWVIPLASGASLVLTQIFLVILLTLTSRRKRSKSR